MEARDWSDTGKGPQAKEYRWPLKQAGKQVSPAASGKGKIEENEKARKVLKKKKGKQLAFPAL